MLTEHQFRENDKLREALKEALETEPLASAIRILEDKAKPRQFHAPTPGVHLDTMVSQHYHRLSGMQAMLDNLRRLAELNPIEAEDKDEPEFFHALPEPIKNALRKQHQA